jgi:capsular exopolysaccharide synthesis family protein
MSRIHEALKKAEQERGGIAPPAESAAATAPVDVIEAPSVRREPATVVDRPYRDSGAARADLRSTPLTIEMLRQRCRQTKWQPDARTMLFIENDQTPGSEEFRTLRSRLYKIREHQKLQTLLISSALPAEGKTFVAANLAQAISRQHERRALLIDADLRKSRLHVVLGAPEGPGLTEYLRGDADEFSVIQRGPQDNLCLIAGGKPATNPAELISSGRFRSLLQRVSSAFDWIIIDSPPVVPVSDASLLAEMCDGVLIVVEAASTPYDLAQKACQEFREKHLLGAVLNRIDGRTGYTSYYYNYGYGYGVTADGKG